MPTTQEDISVPEWIDTVLTGAQEIRNEDYSAQLTQDELSLFCGEHFPKKHVCNYEIYIFIVFWKI
jgi:hypothetical protein